MSNKTTKTGNGSTTPEKQDEIVLRIGLSDLRISEHNTRQPKAADVAELALSMQTIGQTTPAIVRPHPTEKGKFEIAAGARRFVAAKAAAFADLDCVVRKLSDNDFEELLLVENLQREDPDPRAEVALIERLIKRGVHTPEQISAHLGKPKSWAVRRIQLTKVVPELRKLWESRDRYLGHFSVDMMELLGALPVETQKELAEESDEIGDCMSRKALEKYLDERVFCRLDNAPFDLNDKRFFVKGCGPGCACNTGQMNALFDEFDEKHPRCLRPECFRARAELARASAFDALKKEHGDLPIVTPHYLSYGETVKVGGKEIRPTRVYDTPANKPPSKDATKVYVYHEGTGALRIGYIPKERRQSAEGGGQKLQSTGERLAERKRILQGKRWHLVHDELVKALDESKHGDCVEDVIDLVTIFGLPYQAQGYAAKRQWARFDARRKEGFRVDTIHAETFHRETLMAKLVGEKDRLSVLWSALKVVLKQTMRPGGKVGDAANAAPDMRRVAALIKFPVEEKKREANEKIKPPKTWGPVDIHTLEPISRAQQLKQLGVTIKGKTKAFVDALHAEKKFYVVCTRGGRREYCAGDRVEQGKWTLFKDRARTFTAEEAKTAKGKSRASIVPVAGRKASPKKAKTVKTKGKRK